jgi:hypothetical protein
MGRIDLNEYSLMEDAVRDRLDDPGAGALLLRGSLMTEAAVTSCVERLIGVQPSGRRDASHSCSVSSLRGRAHPSSHDY